MPVSGGQPCVFISYRQEDSGGWAGRLEDDLADRFGAQRVFRDMKIPVGVDYREHIERTLDSCRVVIVVIGPQWTTLKGADGNPRLSDPEDLLRREIERAIQRPDVVVIPVLVQRARMPSPQLLPASMHALTRRQALELSDARWSHDTSRLIVHLTPVLGEVTKVTPPRPHADGDTPPTPPREREALSDRQRLIACGAMLAAACLGALLAASFTDELAVRRAFGEPDLDRIVYYAAERGVIFAVVGALVLAAAAVTLRERASALGWAILGLGFGAVGGAASGVAYMALKDEQVMTSQHLLRGVAGAIVGIALAAILARLVDGDRTVYKLAGLAGGLLAGILAQQFFDDPDPTRATALSVCEALVTTGALAAVATTVPALLAPRSRARSRS